MREIRLSHPVRGFTFPGFLLLFVVAGLLLVVPADSPRAQGVSTKSPPARGKDITEAWGTKKLVIGRGLKAKDTLFYTATVNGEIEAAEDNVALRIANDTTVGLKGEFSEPKGKKALEGKWWYTELLIRNKQDGETWELELTESADSDNPAKTELYRNGVPFNPDRSSDPRERIDLPSAGAVRAAMVDPVAYTRLDDAGKLSSLSHAAKFSGTHTRNQPGRLIDPTVFLRALFAGYAGIECAVGQAVEFEALLTTDFVGGRNVRYRIGLVLNKVFGEGEEALAADYTLSARPVGGETISLSQTQVAAPSLVGTLSLDVRKGVVSALDAAGTYDTPEASTTRIKGKVSVSFRLTSVETRHE